MSGVDSSAINRAHAASAAADLALVVLTWIHMDELNGPNQERCLAMGNRLSGFSSQANRPWLDVLIGALQSPEIAEHVSVEEISDGLMALGREEQLDKVQAAAVAAGLRGAARILLSKPDNPGEKRLKLSL